MFSLSYPKTRSQRLRSCKWSRDLFAETSISPKNLIQPFFVTEGKNIRDAIGTMPNVFRYSIDNLITEIAIATELGIKAILLFPQITNDKKSTDAKESYKINNLICRAIREIKKQKFDIGIIADVALDPYTLNGHDGITDKDDKILNDSTIDILCKQSLSLAEAGCDVIAPSDMMDGRVGKIRDSLEQNGFHNTKIISYSAKYASNFYGPFRDAVGSKNCLKNSSKDTYQMDFRNVQEAITEVGLDISEGTDAIIIKPGMPYLDVISSIKKEFNIPIIAYQVSGEYSMLKMAGEKGIFNTDQAFIESFISFKRAGACSIITYAAIEIAKKLIK